MKSSDRAKLRGYHTKWIEGTYMYLTGCAVLVDLLTPCSVFSKVMQSYEVDILEEKVYQCQEIKKYSEAQIYYQNQSQDYCSKVTECIRSRMAWSDLQLMRNIVFILGTQGWEKTVEENDSMEAINRLVERFTVPLQAASANIGEIAGEFEALVHYTIQFISLSTLDYRAVWWRIFHAPTAIEWCNVLLLAKLLFSLPASNGKFERFFLRSMPSKRTNEPCCPMALWMTS